MLGLRRYKGVQIDVYEGDLTVFACDAMVNAANNALSGGGGVDAAIHRVGGPEILAACRAFAAPCPTGQAVVTTAGALPARWVFHAVGPVWDGGTHGEAALLASAYRACLGEADRLGARHLAFPSISTGAYRFPVADAARVAFAAVRAYLEGARAGAGLGRVTLVLYSHDDYRAYQAALFEAFPDEN